VSTDRALTPVVEFNGFCSQCRRVTALAARLLLLIYNLWNLFLRLMHSSEHIEATLFFTHRGTAGPIGQAKKAMQVAAIGAWWKQLRDGYQMGGRVAGIARVSVAFLYVFIESFWVNTPPLAACSYSEF
jgi:hypothetical protein